MGELIHSQACHADCPTACTCFAFRASQQWCRLQRPAEEARALFATHWAALKAATTPAAAAPAGSAPQPPQSVREVAASLLFVADMWPGLVGIDHLEPAAAVLAWLEQVRAGCGFTKATELT